MVLSILYS